MSNKKKAKSADQGTWALCITTGLIIGVGLGPIMGNLLLTAIVGAGIGAGFGYYFTHQKGKH